MRPDDPTQRDQTLRRDTVIGPYRLLELVGQGAMGEVWRAEQSKPVRRIVALKLIKKGMDTREVVTRFEIERQALALMDHPGIATVYDAGEAPDGRPYIALEYVAGEKITDYCERNRLSIEDRLILFQKVCHAIHHAHQKAVIHRDLKPSNILVVERDGEPEPKVIDFGIAKATAQRLTDRSAATYLGQLIGTPLYMSPEQVAMTAAGVDTRADVYSLGVILYELLSGALPFDPEDLAAAGMDEVLRLLRESDAPRPSTRVSTLGDRTAEIAAKRGLDAKKLSGKLRGDLDWITLKALEKDRKRRYESPKDLADDIARFQQTEAIQARPPSVTYRVSRFTRRYRAQVTVGLAAMLLLIAFATWQTVQSQRLAAAVDRAIAGEKASIANERIALAREHLRSDPTVALAFARSALDLGWNEDAAVVARRAATSGPIRDQVDTRDGHGNPLGVDLSPDFRRVAIPRTHRDTTTIDLIDVDRWNCQPLRGGTGTPIEARWNTNGEFVAAAIWGTGFRAWSVRTKSIVVDFETSSTEEPFSVYPTFDPNRMLAATQERGGRLHWYALLLDEGTAVSLGRSGPELPNQTIRGPAVTGDGRWIVDAAGPRVFVQKVDELESASIVDVLSAPAEVEWLTLSADDSWLALGDRAGNVQVWEFGSRSPELLRSWSTDHTHDRGVFDAFSPRLVVFGQFDNRALAFELDRPADYAPVTIQDEGFWFHDATYLPNDTLLMSRNGLGLALWRAVTQPAFMFPPHSRFAYLLEGFTADGSRRLVWQDDRILSLPLEERTSVEVDTLAAVLEHSTGIGGAAFFDEEGSIAVTTIGLPRRTLVTSLRTGRSRWLEFGEASVHARALSPRGSRVLAHVIPTREAALQTLPGSTPRVDAEPSNIVVEVETMEVVASDLVDAAAFPRVGDWGRTAFRDEDRIVHVADSVVVQFDLSAPESDPDTLWVGDTRLRAYVESRARSILLWDSDGVLWHLNPWTSEKTRVLEQGARASYAMSSPANNLVAVGGWSLPEVVVIDLATQERWHVPAEAYGMIHCKGLGFDPLGRWLVIEDGVGMKFWDLPLKDVLRVDGSSATERRLRRLTNVAVTPDSSQASGYRTDYRDLILR